ncbi:exopolysaccharide biosynthesis protein [Marinimicrobium sp. C2-29]|uniref:exopolysaccharide biosynthesis protein n=1 Tax=Marinimicrobium sp. C2-29 TaxID=3139825 RepID=UPI00313A4B54
MDQTPLPTAQPDPRNLEQLLNHIARVSADQERVSIGTVVNSVGQRSFAPLLLVIGAALTSPLSGIPGFPTTMAIFVLLVAVQLLVGRDHFWLPQWLLRRSVPRARLLQGIHWLQRPAQLIDRAVKPRLTLFVRGTGQYTIAAICIVIALGVPLLEIVPFLATLAGVVLTMFGLSLVAYDGALALLAFVLTAVAFGLVLYGAA